MRMPIKIISESLNNKQKGIEAFEVEKSDEGFKDSREILLKQAGSFKDDELLDFIYKERRRSMRYPKYKTFRAIPEFRSRKLD